MLNICILSEESKNLRMKNLERSNFYMLQEASFPVSFTDTEQNKTENFSHTYRQY